MNRKAIFIGQLMASACIVAPAYAQTAATTTAVAPTSDGGGTKLEEVVVTAQRRTESLQRVPIAVTAVSGADLAARESGRRAFAEFVKLDRDLQPAPNVTVANSGQLLFANTKRRRVRAVM